MRDLLEDLVDFNRTNLGLGINIEVGECDLERLFKDELRQHKATNPGRRVELTVEGAVTGVWDGRRLQQVLRNLLSNAITYGKKGEAVHVTVHGDEAGVRIEVTNSGAAIPPNVAETLFDPLKRGDQGTSRRNSEGLGLGLYIVREIPRAHGGDAGVLSSDEETVFYVSFPRSGNRKQLGEIEGREPTRAKMP